MYQQAWKNDPDPSPGLIFALSDDLNTPDAVAYIRETISKWTLLDDRQRVALVHDTRFLGVITEVQRPWLAPSIMFENMAVNLFQQAYTHFRDYHVFCANNDIERMQQERSWFHANQMEVLHNPLSLRYLGDGLRRSQLEDLIEERSAARAASDWAKSDRIRDELAAMGIALKDNKDGTTSWEPKR